MRANLYLTWLTVLPLLGACDGGSDDAIVEPEPTSELGREGEAVYRSVVDDGNSFACATCHALTEPASDFRRPGHSLGDAAARESYKNGQLTELRDAVNSCLTEWMVAEPWSEDDERWVALSTFLEEIAPARAEALSFTIVAPPTPNELTGGDAAAGQALFNASCAGCHGTDGTGTERGLPVSGRALDPGYIALRVRSSGRADSSVYDGLTGGVMPFWAADRLSASELRDIVAWLSDDPGTADDNGADDNSADDNGADDNSADDNGADDSGTDDSGTDDGSPGNCIATHPKVGQTAELQGFFHNVGGTAEIVDDCTIRITDFTYDGTGIDVRLYGALGGDFDNGVAIGDDLVRNTPYLGETIELVLPEGSTFDDVDSVSVWCVDVGVDFGSGFFG